MRKLASIQTISEIRPIPEADKIVMARVLGYECVVKKEDAKVGDLGVYFEVDSLLPDKPEFEFLRDVKFRIKIRKFKKQISMGLFMPMSILPSGNYNIGDDVTELLEVKNYERISDEAEENANISQSKKLSPLTKYLLNYKLFREIYFKFNKKEKGSWPQWLAHTDEERLQGCPRILLDNLGKSFYISVKCDGQSFSTFCHKSKSFLGFTKYSFGVCSRNIWLKTEDQSNYWNIARKYALKKKLLALKKNIVIQGELCGPGIQKNKLKLDTHKLFVFNVIEDGRQYSLQEMIDFCNKLDLSVVPIISTNWIAEFPNMDKNQIIDAMVEMFKGNNIITKDEREGIVVRLNENPRVSFKVINPNYLLKKED